MKVYIAGKISGYSYDEVVNYFKQTADRLEKIGYETMHPMLGKSALRTEIAMKSEGYGNPESTNHAIIERDRWMVENSDIILCDLTMANRVSIGSVMELAWAEYLHKLVIVVMENSNIHRHAFVLEAADVIFETIEEAFVYLENLKGA